MKREHSDMRCEQHWQIGPLSSIYPGPCSRETRCPCACHANGVEALISLLAKLGIKSAADRLDPWSIHAVRSKY